MWELENGIENITLIDDQFSLLFLQHVPLNLRASHALPPTFQHRCPGQRKHSSAKSAQLRNNGRNRHGPIQGTQLRRDSGNPETTPEEEFFCLTPEDSRSIVSTNSGGSGRSRNASATSVNSGVVGGKSTSSKPLPIQMGLPDTKIFSVAVEARPTDHTGTDSMVVCDVDTDYTGRFAVVSSCYPNKPSPNDYQRKHAATKAESRSGPDAHTKNHAQKDQSQCQPIKYSKNAKSTEKCTLDQSKGTIDTLENPADFKMSNTYSTPEPTSVKSANFEILESQVPVDSHCENVKSDTSDRSKTGKRGKKKKRGGNGQPKLDLPSSFGTSPNIESGSSADTDAIATPSLRILETDKKITMLKNKKDCSTNDKKDMGQADDNDIEVLTTPLKPNKELDVDGSNRNSNMPSDTTGQKDTSDNIILDLDETLSSAFAENPKEGVDLLKDGSQQSFDNMSTEELLAEALLSTITDECKYDDLIESKISVEENFSSEFSKAVSIRDSEKEAEDEDEMEEPFIIKEETPDSDDSISSEENEDISEKEKYKEQPPPSFPLINPEETAHPLTEGTSIRMPDIQSSLTMLLPTPANQKSSGHGDNLFDEGKRDASDKGSDIINKIKLAEKIYDNSNEDSENSGTNKKQNPPRSFAAALNADLHLSAKGALTENKKATKHPFISADTSEDDLETVFQPALSRKQKRQKKHAAAKTDLSRRTSGASFADSESSLIDEDESNVSFEGQDATQASEECKLDSELTKKSSQEGWSFEADDLDVNRLIAEVVNDNATIVSSHIEGKDTNQNKKDSHEEKACLDEVFKFDAELAVANTTGPGNSEDDENMDDPSNINETERGLKDQWNNLNTEDDTSEDDNATNIIISSTKNKTNKMSKSLNVKVDAENNKIEKDTSSDNDNNTTSIGASKNTSANKGSASLSHSLVLGTTTEGTTSESSVGNSPNPRKTTKKSKKQKKKKF